MKRIVCAILSVVMLMALCACGTTEKALTSTKWVNVYDGDVYSFEKGGKGTHGKTNITYTVDGDTVEIMEGATAKEADVYTLDTKTEPARLTPAKAQGYYVPEESYEEIGGQVRKENVEKLTSLEAWKSTTATAYLMFSASESDSGSGWMLLTGTTIPMTWEMVDNNTVKTHITYAGVDRSSTLDIVEADDGLILVDSSSYQVLWRPKK